MASPDPDSNAVDRGPAPLADIRVLELGHLISGPFCGQILADFGADVIKVEPPATGDPLRQWGLDRTQGRPVWWGVLARNKRSITVDVRKVEGQQLVARLAANADVVVENFRPGTLEKWGLGYEQLSAKNRGLILARVSGYGQTGPYSRRPGYGSIGEAMGGLRYVVGEPDSPPSRTGVSIGDSLAGLLSVVGVLVALRARDRTGRGQVVDTSIYEAVLAVMESLVPDYAVGGYVRERTGAILPHIAPSNAYPTADGSLVLIAANQDTVFARLAQAMGAVELASDKRFSSHQARGSNQAVLDELIGAWSQTITFEELEESLERHDVPFGRIYRAPEMLRDPHFQARRSIIEVEDEDIGTLSMQNVFPILSETPGKVRHPGRRLGADTESVLQEMLGLTLAEIGTLRQEGAI